MITTHSLPPLDASIKTAVTIGTFDGVHLGHTQIIKQLVEKAKILKVPAVVLSFYPHPRIVLHQDSGIKLLDSLQEKAAKLEDLGVDYFVVYPFSKSFSRMKAATFVSDILVKGLHAKSVLIGYDHRFGRNRNADINDLKSFGETYGFDVEEISAQDINEVAVSSTKIRAALIAGDIQKANTYLGYNFMLTGEVTKGRGLGKQLSFPTANIKIDEDYKIIPKQGSYIICSNINDAVVYGMMNIGVNPTVNGIKQTIEVHFFDFQKDIYGEIIQIDLLHRIRDEEKFESVEALKVQLAKDKEKAFDYISKHHAK